MHSAQQWHVAHHCAHMHTGSTHVHELVQATGIKSIDTKAGMLSGISQKHKTRSKLFWFTEFCNSQRLSHFAAPFIVVRAETSIAESCMCIHVAMQLNPINTANISNTQTVARMAQQTPHCTTRCCYPRTFTWEFACEPTPSKGSHTLFRLSMVDMCE